MTLGMWQNGSIPMLRDGTQWRPMIHIRDTSKAFIAALNAPRETIDGQLFNVGSNDQNYQIMQCAELVAKGMGIPFKFEWYGDPDHRSYRVNFDKINEVLGFTPDWTPDRAALEILEALRSGKVVADEKTKTLGWYSTLIEWEARLKELAPDGKIF
jgi:nucleoside-diphosphate-sugar epimerase